MLKSLLATALIILCLALVAATIPSTTATTTSPFVAWGRYGVTENYDFSDAVAVAAGYVHTVVLRGDGTVMVWSHGSQDLEPIPATVQRITAIAAGYYHTLALRDDGTVVAWGDNRNGQIDVPSGLNTVIAIAAGNYHSVALKADGTVVVWGDNEDVYHLKQVPAGLHDVVAIAAGESNILVLRKDGTVVGWGSNVYGQTTAPSSLANVTAIALGHSISVALKADGTVVTFGDAVDLSPVPPGLHGVTAISASYQHILALQADGTVMAWGGSNLYGELNVPSGLRGVTAIAAGGSHSVALTQHGGLHIPTTSPTPTTFPTVPLTPTMTPVANEAVIDAEGGEVVSTDGSVRLLVPAGAVSESVRVTYTSQHTPSHILDDNDVLRKSFLLQAEDDAGNAILHTQIPYMLTITYVDQAHTAQATGETQLNMVAWDGSQWVRMLPCPGCTQDPVNHRITVRFDHFTEFAVVASSWQEIRLPIIRS
jgi:hypothetical protein